MAANKSSASDEMNEDTTAVSMVEVLEDEELLENDMNAVLGGSDSHNCTYSKGYVDRQALYSCSTCTPSESVSAGVCLSCSLACHEGHDLHELYTKRNFRCDCGNQKFGNLTCKKFQDKDAVNERNKYNQNFQGLYCTCHRPYPDPEDDVDDEMIQCVICEDWYHTRHLDCEVPNSEYEAMVCGGCLQQCAFLRSYAPLYSASSDSVTKLSQTDESSSVDVSTADSDTSCLTTDTASTDNQLPGPSTKRTSSAPHVMASPAKKLKSEEGSSPADGGQCRLDQLSASLPGDGVVSKGAAFWKSGWRLHLCKCDKCISMYEKLEVSFLMDLSDTISAYESRGKEKNEGSQYDQAMKALTDMDRVQQVEIMQEYNDMKTQLTDYLKSFADEGKVVTKDDIKQFFDRIMASKQNKPRPGVQYLCK